MKKLIYLAGAIASAAGLLWLTIYGGIEIGHSDHKDRAAAVCAILGGALGAGGAASGVYYQLQRQKKEQLDTVVNALATEIGFIINSCEEAIICLKNLCIGQAKDKMQNLTKRTLSSFSEIERYVLFDPVATHIGALGILDKILRFYSLLREYYHFLDGYGTDVLPRQIRYGLCSQLCSRIAAINEAGLKALASLPNYGEARQSPYVKSAILNGMSVVKLCDDLRIILDSLQAKEDAEWKAAEGAGIGSYGGIPSTPFGHYPTHRL
jgi:hypothetical protein